MTPRAIAHRFVTEVPREIEVELLYVSIAFGTAVHRCPGCQRKVATPFAPGSWNLIFDGETVSIFPSIRTAAHGCGSHYWIRNDTIIEAFDAWSEETGPSATAIGRRSPDALSWLELRRALDHRSALEPPEPSAPTTRRRNNDGAGGTSRRDESSRWDDEAAE